MNACDLDSRLLTFACKDFAKTIKHIPSYKQELIDKLSYYDLARCDLEHELELSPLNAVEITKCTIRLRMVLRERRKVKDELESIRAIKSRNIDFQIEKLNEQMEKKKTRRYKPRIFKDLKIGRISQ